MKRDVHAADKNERKDLDFAYNAREKSVFRAISLPFQLLASLAGVDLFFREE